MQPRARRSSPRSSASAPPWKPTPTRPNGCGPSPRRALHDAGLFGLKAPRELGGGLEADPLTQIEVYEAVSRIDTSAGWALIAMTAGSDPPRALAMLFPA
ncbi:MAG: acyl-CoA dehydrogenase family protein [Chloroflexi bacterium]|nr:acyl-CoA dehydrogenase family protein [Chloroflexota bacterium]